MQRWELKRLWMPLNVELQRDTSKQHTYYIPSWNAETRKIWAQAETLSAEGWELVTAIPETGGHELAFEQGIKALGVGSSYTLGYLLIFKRQKG